MKNIYSTSDLNLATTLSCLFPIVNINRTDSRRAEFEFEDTEELNNVIFQYWNNELSLNPREVLSALKEIKNRLYA